MAAHSPERGRGELRLDGASVALLVVGLIFGALAYWLIVRDSTSPLILVPAVVAATVGATHLTKREAPHDRG